MEGVKVWVGVNVSVAVGVRDGVWVDVDVSVGVLLGVNVSVEVDVGVFVHKVAVAVWARAITPAATVS